MRDKIIAVFLIALFTLSVVMLTYVGPKYHKERLIECMELGGKYIDMKCYKGDFVELEL